MNQLHPDDEAKLTQFVECYNAIDRFLRDTLEQPSYTEFGSLVRSYETKNPWWRDGRSLRRFADLRNTVAHNRIPPYTYMAVPHQAALDEIRLIEQRLTAPRFAEPCMHKNVVAVQTGLTVYDLMNLVAAHDFSQFPVFDEKAFMGLVTENGITRWLGDHLNEVSIDLVEFKSATVQDILAKDESQDNYAFVSKRTTAAEVNFLFKNDPRLEAVFLTHNGRKTERLLAISTRWDVPLET